MIFGDLAKVTGYRNQLFFGEAGGGLGAEGGGGTRCLQKAYEWAAG